MDLIYYHNACPDGWCAAWIAKKKYPNAELRPLDHGLTELQIHETLLEMEGRDALMLDYSFRRREDNDCAKAWAKSFRILDHHKTAQAVLEGAPYAVFDMERSGAGLTWDYLFGKDAKPTEWIGDEYAYMTRPWVVDYVEARDLWKWERQPDSRAVCAYLGTIPFRAEEWDKLLIKKVDEVKRLGYAILSNIENYVEITTQNVEYGTLFGHKVGVINVTYVNTSEVGNAIAKTADFSLAWFERKGVYSFSLRSVGNFDVSAIAKRFQGGGHFNAAGFQLGYKEGRLLIDRILGRSTEETNV